MSKTNCVGRNHIFDNLTKKKELTKLYLEGYSLVQLSLYYDVCLTTLKYHLKKAGKYKNPTRYKEDILAMVKDGKPLKKIAKKFDIPISTISLLAARSGIKNIKIYSNGKKLVLRMAPRWPRYKLFWGKDPTHQYFNKIKTSTNLKLNPVIQKQQLENFKVQVENRRKLLKQAKEKREENKRMNDLRKKMDMIRY